MSRLAALLACAAIVAAALMPRAAAAMEIQEVRAQALTAWLVEDASPLVQLEFAWRHPSASPSLSTPSDAGLTWLTMALLEEGRSAPSGAPLREALEALGAQWHARATPEGGRLSLRMLAHTKDEVWALLVAALAEPRAPRRALDRVKARAQTLRAADAQSPQRLARQLWRRAAFPQHPYGAPIYGSEAGMGAVRLGDVRAHHRRLFTQRSSVIGAVGAINAEELTAWLAQLAERLPAGAPRTAPEPAPRWQRGGEIVQLKRAGPQTFVWFGLPGPMRTSADYTALQLANLVLGGGSLGSRLMQEIREKRGLAYSASSFVRPLAIGSLWQGALASDNGSAAIAYGLVRSEMERLAREGLSPAELDAAQRQFLGRIAVGLRSGEAIAEQLLLLQLYDRPKDFLARLPERVNAVTNDTLRRAAARWLDAGQLFAVAIGMSPDLLPPAAQP